MTGPSLWQDQVGPLAPRGPLPGDGSVDVAVVGGGYTGLWTAFHLARQDPSLRIVVVEREHVGFGASGRNGGWCSALFPTSWERLARAAGRERAVAMQRALEQSVEDIGASGIDCDFARGGLLSLARSTAQLERGRSEVRAARAFGFGPDTLDLVDGPTARARLAATGVLGAVTSSHCAALQPARLVRGLAAAAEALGVRIHEGTEARSIGPGLVRTTHGTLRADVVLPATEGYTAQLPGRRRELAPIWSLMLATEPLPDDVWEQIGLADRATFSDGRHLTVYGQRTADGRIAFGGRGARYHLGSRVRPSYDVVQAVHDRLWRELTAMLPVLAGARVTHRWGGNLGVPRDWFPSVGLDRGTGLAWAGGYVGDGVAASQLAGRTLADLVLGHDSELTRLPWVRVRTKRWEPEPLRWLGVNGVTQLMRVADATEARTGRPSRAAHAFWAHVGH